MKHLRTTLNLALAAFLLSTTALASDAGSSPNPIHPSFRLLDAKGVVIHQVGRAPDQIRTCGQCHSTAFIIKHNLPAHQQHKIDCLTCHYEGGKADWNAGSFEPDGMLKRAAIKIFRPSNDNCGICHGLVSASKSAVAAPPDYVSSAYPPAATEQEHYQLTRAAGVIYSPEEVSASLLNLAGKQDLRVPWDVHARKLMLCTDCHYAPNNPQGLTRGTGEAALLRGEPRRETVRGYLQWPDHTLVEADCRTCHQAEHGHAFLPYRARHMEVLACQSCHIPRVLGPAEQAVNATMLDATGNPLVEYRGIGGVATNLNTAFNTGYEPVLLPMPSPAGTSASPRIAPYNVVSRWYWTAEGSEDPIPQETLRQALTINGQYRPEVMAAFDGNHDGRLDSRELRLDSEAKRGAVAQLLTAVGVKNPTVRAEVQLQRVSHGVPGRSQALSDCSACHSANSRLGRKIVLATWVPVGALPEWRGPAPAGGSIRVDSDQAIIWAPAREATRAFHVFGLARSDWPSQVGLLMLIGVVLAVAIHATYRFLTRGPRGRPSRPLRKAYLFTIYERVWHWTMALSVVGLTLTGLQIHFPDSVHVLGPLSLVGTHNFFAAVMFINAFLALFYHLATAAIRQFLPARHGVLEALTSQTKYYLRDIFKGLPSPSPRSLGHKLNVLQQITYLLLLNVLFPFQILTGIAMWGVGWSPEFARWIGGLYYLAPLHNLGSWMFISFLVAHVYLTTTGHTVFAHLRGMIEGFEEVEDLVPAEGGRR